MQASIMETKRSKCYTHFMLSFYCMGFQCTFAKISYKCTIKTAILITAKWLYLDNWSQLILWHET